MPRGEATDSAQVAARLMQFMKEPLYPFWWGNGSFINCNHGLHVMIDSPEVAQLVGGGNGLGNIIERKFYCLHEAVPMCEMGGDGAGEGATCAMGGDANCARVRPMMSGTILLHQNIGACIAS